jgi:hypothetical protein
MTRPRVFISSTVLDFADLRSALRFWLEQQGFEVQLSDHADFHKDLNNNSYDACLRAIESCTHFVLLIGTRVGGWYDEAERVSITRMEYRHAYELQREGKLRMAAFVRRQIWDIREDRRGLSRLLEENAAAFSELDEAARSRLTTHRSRFVNDAEATFSFIQEVGRVDEMNLAQRKAGKFPSANWVHFFSDFQDIVDTLRIEFAAKDELGMQATRVGLQREILQNLAELFVKLDGTTYPGFRLAESARRAITGGIKDNSELPEASLTGLMAWLLTASAKGRRLQTRFLDDAITSGRFLDYSVDTQGWVIGGAQECLIRLREEIEHLLSIQSLLQNKERMELVHQINTKCSVRQSLVIENLSLIAPMSILDVQESIVLLCIALLGWLDGRNSIPILPSRRAASPLPDYVEDIEREQVTTADVSRYLFEEVEKPK